LDRTLEGSDGFILAENILAEPHLTDALIVMTTVIEQGAPARCHALSVEHVTKPVAVRDLSSAIQRALHKDSGFHSTATPAKRTPSPDPARQQLKVLLAEDNKVNQKLVVRLLERAGHSVEVAADGIQALEALAARHFDCVLMDVQMPRMDGIETTRALRKLETATTEHIPIVAMTAHALDGDRARCLEAGMDDYIAKPISKDQLLKILGSISSAKRCDSVFAK
jgi:two-component system sensor histidine kinase/response regulator